VVSRGRAAHPDDPRRYCGAAAEGEAVIEAGRDGLRATFTMREGESGRGVVLEPGGEPKSLPPEELNRLAEHDGHGQWLGRRRTQDGGGRWSTAPR
jgi:hypothetical protein